MPGPIGPSGADGADGSNGVSAYTTLTAAFTMPAEGATATATVANSSWMAPGNYYYLQGCGWLRCTAIASSTSITLENVENTASLLYTANVAPATVIAIGSKLVAAGIQGPSGVSGDAPIDAQYLVATANGTLSAEVNLGALATGFLYGTVAAGVSNISAVTRGIANANIPPVDDVAGLTNGQALFATAGGIESQAAATARTSLGLAIGTNVQAYDAFLTSMAALGTAADRMIYTTGVDTAAEAALTAAGRALIDDASATAQRTTLGVQRAPQDILIYQHQLAAGTDAGDFTLGAWRTVPLNTEVADTGGHGSIAANTVTLATGVYRVRWHMYGYQVDRFQSRLFNVTTASTVALGSTTKSAAADASVACSQGEGRITIAAATEDIRIEAQCETTNLGDGFGIANAFGGTQVYAGLWLEKEVG